MYTGADNLGLAMNSFDKWLKNWYLQKNNLNGLMYKDPILSRIKRLPQSSMVGGRRIIAPIRIGRSPTASKDFATAQKQAKARTGAREQFEAALDEDYAVARIHHKTVLASKTDMMAFIKAGTDEVDEVIDGLRKKRCTALFANVPNSCGSVKSIASGRTSFTLGSPSQASGLDIGDQIVFAQTAATAVRSATASNVVSVNRADGVVNISAALPAGIAANDNIYREGDFSTTKTALSSFKLFLPGSAGITTANKTLYNLDRSREPVRLGGHHFAMGQNDLFSVTIRKMVANIYDLIGEYPNAVYCNSRIEDIMSREMVTTGVVPTTAGANVARVDYSSGGPDAYTKLGAGRFGIQHRGGVLEVVTSPFCPVEDIYVMNEDTWGLHYLADQSDDFVHFYKDPATGSMVLTAYDAPGFEVRVESFGQLMCRAPGANGRITVHSTKVTEANK